MQQATSYLQGMSNPFGGVLESYGQGQVLRQNSDLLKAQQAEQARKITAQQQLEALDWSNQDEIARVVAQFPEYTKGAQDYYNKMEAKEQQAVLADMSKSIASIDSGRPEIAVNNMREKAAAYADMGNEEKAEEYRQMAEWMAKDPVSARKALMMNYAVLSPDKSGANFKSYTDGNIAEDKAPHEIASIDATTGATNATANKTNAETGEVRAKTEDAVNTIISNAAVTQNPQHFMSIVERLSDQGLIPVTLEDSLRAKLSGEDVAAAAAELRSIAMGNPVIAQAFKTEHKFIDLGSHVEGIEWSPMSGETRSTTGVMTKGVSPNTQYSVDASERNVALQVKQSDINSQRTAQTAANAEQTKRDKIALDNYLAQQKIELESGKFTQKTMPDGRVMLFNNLGQMKPVIDPETGKPMISKKADPSIEAEYRKEKARQDKLAVLLPEIRALIPESTGSVAGVGIDYLARGFGVTTDGAAAAAKLKSLGGQLVMMMPRMEGPQSDKDVALYKEMAGNVGSATMPRALRLAALDAIEGLNKKYADLNKSSQVKEDDLF